MKIGFYALKIRISEVPVLCTAETVKLRIPWSPTSKSHGMNCCYEANLAYFLLIFFIHISIQSIIDLEDWVCNPLSRCEPFSARKPKEPSWISQLNKISGSNEHIKLSNECFSSEENKHLATRCSVKFSLTWFNVTLTKHKNFEGIIIIFLNHESNHVDGMRSIKLSKESQYYSFQLLEVLQNHGSNLGLKILSANS